MFCDIPDHRDKHITQGYFVTHSVTHSLWPSASPQNILLSAFFSCHSLLITFQQWPESGKKFRGFVILSWRIEWLNELFFSHSKIFRILRYVSIYWHVSSLYWDIDQVGTHDTCHTVSHNVTWRPCQISWQPCHFIINFIYKSKYLITKENIQSQWFLNPQNFLSFLA